MLIYLVQSTEGHLLSILPSIPKRIANIFHILLDPHNIIRD